MELTLEVSPQTIKKIQKIAQISGKDSAAILGLLSSSINKTLDLELIGASKAMLAELGVDTSLFSAPQPDVSFDHASLDLDAIKQIMRKQEAKNPQPKSVLTSTHTFEAEEDPYEDEDDDEPASFVMNDEDEDDDEDYDGGVAASLGATEDEFENMDQELPEEVQEEFMPPKEEDMADVKDKDGNPARYEDDFMNDLQDEADELEGSDDILAAASASYNDEDDLEGGAVGAGGKTTSLADDSPTGEDGHVPDVLPMDFGLDKVAGDDKAAASFFASALAGKMGDKSKRNQVRRKRLRND